ncbi:MAG TPA: hydroxyacid dehydrogenase [Candidatus Dormibacteraeota bacterium]|nr:hydroxyacid dehydrogenase [Candidatus Dormibacteraeota bacterium]
MSRRPLVVQCYPMMHPAPEERLRQHVELRTLSATDADTVISEAAGAVAIIGRGPARIGAAVLDALPSLGFACATGSGADWIDLAACRERGIPVAHNPGVAPGPVAEYVLATMVALYKRLPEADAHLRGGGAWEPRDAFRGREVSGRVLGLVGLGAIGSDVARRARAAFDMTVLAFDPGATDERFETHGVTRALSIAEVFAAADIVSIHVPLLPETRGLVGAAELQHCKPGAVLVNASRGGVVDEAALVEALRSGRLSGAAVDVFDPEPPRSDNPLFAMPNVIVTPHTAGITEESLIKLGDAVANNVIGALRGERPPHLVNPESWPPARLAV